MIENLIFFLPTFLLIAFVGCNAEIAENLPATVAPVATTTTAAAITGIDCGAILSANSGVLSGVYTITPSGGSAMSAYCDMTTDGGGWTLVLNYLHQATTDPNLSILTTRLPLLGSTTLGGDESTSTTTWGHAGNALIARINPSEIRMNCKTSNHARIIDFKTNLPGAISYFKTGTGTFSGIAGTYTAFSDHTATIPGGAVNFITNQGDLAMTMFPFWWGPNHHWGIKGSGNSDRWECDDQINVGGGVGYSTSTLHQVWVR